MLERLFKKKDELQPETKEVFYNLELDVPEDTLTNIIEPHLVISGREYYHELVQDMLQIYHRLIEHQSKGRVIAFLEPSHIDLLVKSEEDVPITWPSFIAPEKQGFAKKYFEEEKL